MIVKLNGVVVKSPSDFREERYNVTKGNRLADASMSLDLIAKKKKYYLTYKCLTSAEFQIFMGIIDSANMFFKVSINIDNIDTELNMYVGAIQRTRYWSYNDQMWLWKDISFNFIER